MDVGQTHGIVGLDDLAGPDKSRACRLGRGLGHCASSYVVPEIN